MYDILIIGSGIVGATTALALAQQTSLRIALVDAKPMRSEWQAAYIDKRVSAISLASQRLFQNLGVWDAIMAKRVSPYQRMHVWDARTTSVLDFDSRMIQAAVLGYIIEDSVMRSSLLTALQQYSTVTLLAPLKLMALRETSDAAFIETDTAGTLQATLVIGADGAHSWLRTAAGIDMVQADYAERAIVATVTTTQPHQQTAWQRFLPTGPLAFLPLSDPMTCSIVWSTTPEEARRLLALEADAFSAAVTENVAAQLGQVTVTSQRDAFDLQMRHVSQYVKPHLALVGDAAHTLHPMAGQGVNLGLLDAAYLVEQLTLAWQAKRSVADFSMLRRYERARKADNAMMLEFVAAIKALFTNETRCVIGLRQLGMAITNRTDVMKMFFANYASGNRVAMPALTLATTKL